jgi:hypothetical protein
MNARRTVELATQYPYHGVKPASKAEVAACAVLQDLNDRKGLKHELQAVADYVRFEIVTSLTEIIAEATKPDAPGVSLWQRMGDARPDINEHIMYRELGTGVISEVVYQPSRQSWMDSDTWIYRDLAFSKLTEL